jgi:hypothetical protein
VATKRAAMYLSGSAPTVAHNTATKINLNETEYDTDGAMADEPNHRINITKTGYYDVQGLVAYDLAAADSPETQARINVDGTPLVVTSVPLSLSSYARISVGRELHLTAGQYVELATLQLSGVTATINVSLMYLIVSERP